jgi:hypothetical protein
MIDNSSLSNYNISKGYLPTSKKEWFILLTISGKWFIINKNKESQEVFSIKTVAVIGSHTKLNFEDIARVEKKLQFRFVHYNARIKKKNGKRDIEMIIKMADFVILLTNACSHQSMWDARELAKKYNKPIYYNRGLGATRAIEKVKEAFCKDVA